MSAFLSFLYFFVRFNFSFCLVKSFALFAFKHIARSIYRTIFNTHTFNKKWDVKILVKKRLNEIVFQ